jgi:hypothetical protein
VEKTKPKYESRGIDGKMLTGQIKAGVAAVYASGDWKAALAFNSKFWTYSFGNQFLITMQKPGASRVAGFNTWKALGRNVTKGEKGLAILAPLFAGGKGKKDGAKAEVKTEGGAAVETPANKTKPGALFGFKVTYVFDISQTNGKAVPEYCHKLKGAAPAGLIEGLTAYLAGLGVPVAYEAMAESLGGFVRRVGVDGAEIRLNVANEPAQQAKTLIHEAAHFLAGHLDKRGLEMGTEAKELEAESAAFIVGSVLGVDFSEYSFGYLASWARGFEDTEARDKALEKAGAKAAAVAKLILAGVDAKKEAEAAQV